MHEKLNIRLANIDDIENVFELSNDDFVRANSINPEKIEWEAHVKWFEKRITQEHFYIVEIDADFAAQVRIDDGVISISIKKEYRGKGLGAKIIAECSKKSGLEKITALVSENNPASLRAFEKSGYKYFCDRIIKVGKFLVLKYEQ